MLAGLMQFPRHRARGALEEMPMASPNVFPFHPSTKLAPRAAESDIPSCAFESEGPASAPTILVEVDEIAVPTALPAPPRLPMIAAVETWRPPPSSPVPVIRPALALVRPAAWISNRPTVRVPENRSHKLRVVRPSSPPTVPPPSPAMRRAA